MDLRDGPVGESVVAWRESTFRQETLGSRRRVPSYPREASRAGGIFRGFYACIGSLPVLCLRRPAEFLSGLQLVSSLPGFTSTEGETRMLVLSRRPQEAVLIGTPPNQIRVIVAGIRGDRVRLGFEAAHDVPIHREELVVERDAGSPQRDPARDPFLPRAE